MRQKTQALLLRSLVYLGGMLTVGSAVVIVGYILIKGIPNLSLGLFALDYSSDNHSLFPAMINTVTITVVSLILAVPTGIFSAVYMVEYARRGNRLVKIVGMTAETLAGIPSIVYGLFGYLFFVDTLGWGYSLMAGAFTLAIMILPIVMRTAQEALKSVPDSFREGSFGLGAGKLRTVFNILIPAAMPGILSGVILSTGRIVGETAALIYTAGTVAKIPQSLFGSGRTLSVHMYALWNEGINTDASYATAVVLLIVVVIINFLSSALGKKMGKGSTNG